MPKAGKRIRMTRSVSSAERRTGKGAEVSGAPLDPGTPALDAASPGAPFGAAPLHPRATHPEHSSQPGDETPWDKLLRFRVYQNSPTTVRLSELPDGRWVRPGTPTGPSVRRSRERAHDQARQHGLTLIEALHTLGPAHLGDLVARQHIEEDELCRLLARMASGLSSLADLCRLELWPPPHQARAPDQA